MVPRGSTAESTRNQRAQDSRPSRGVFGLVTNGLSADERASACMRAEVRSEVRADAAFRYDQAVASRRWLVILATLASTGCTLLVSTSGLVGDGPVPGPDASDAPSTDSPPVEASTDSPVDVLADAGPKSPCAASHLFCDDFDRTNAAASGWTRSDVSAKGTLSLSPTRAVTAPYALFTQLPRRNPTDVTESATLTQIIQRSFTKITIAYDTFIERPDFSDGDINVGVGCFNARYNNTRGATCISVGADYSGVFQTQLGPWPWDRWVHVELSMPVEGVPSATITSTAGTKTVTGSYEISVDVGEPDIRVELGLQSYNKPAPGFTAYYDNVVIDAQ